MKKIKYSNYRYTCKQVVFWKRQ